MNIKGRLKSLETPYDKLHIIEVLGASFACFNTENTFMLLQLKLLDLPVALSTAQIFLHQFCLQDHFVLEIDKLDTQHGRGVES